MIEEVLVRSEVRGYSRQEQNQDYLVRYPNENLVLRTLLLSDLCLVSSWFNQERMKFFRDNCENRCSTEELFDSLFNRANKTDLSLIVEDRFNEKPIGYCSIYDIEEYKSAEISFLIGVQSYWGYGYGSQIVKSLSEFAKKELYLDHLVATVISENFLSLNCLEKNGFKKRGINRNSVILGSNLYHHITMMKKL